MLIAEYQHLNHTYNKYSDLIGIYISYEITL